MAVAGDAERLCEQGKPAQDVVERPEPVGVSICSVWCPDGPLVTLQEPSWAVQRQTGGVADFSDI